MHDARDQQRPDELSILACTPATLAGMGAAAGAGLLGAPVGWRG
jgi:hypothetical protein